jgi:hypothetical protein
MNRIKTFETFDFSQTLPMVSKSDLTLFYHCDECNALWKEFNKEVENCKFCKSEDIEELSEDEWYESIGDRLDEDEFEEMKSEREDDSGSFIDLTNLSNKYKN